MLARPCRLSYSSFVAVVGIRVYADVTSYTGVLAKEVALIANFGFCYHVLFLVVARCGVEPLSVTRSAGWSLAAVAFVP